MQKRRFFFEKKEKFKFLIFFRFIFLFSMFVYFQKQKNSIFKKNRERKSAKRILLHGKEKLFYSHTFTVLSLYDQKPVQTLFATLVHLFFAKFLEIRKFLLFSFGIRMEKKKIRKESRVAFFPYFFIPSFRHSRI